MSANTAEKTFRLPYRDEFLAYCHLERGLSENTVAAYGFDLDRLEGYLGREGIDDCDAIVPDVLSRYVRILHDLGFCATSVQRTLSALRGYFSFVVAEGMCRTDPTELLESPRTRRYLPTVLSADEVARVLDAVDLGRRGGIRDRALIETLYATGVRVSECIELTAEQVMRREGLIRVFGKGSKERLVPIGAAALYWIDKYNTVERPVLARPFSDNTVFLNMRGGGLSRMGVWKIIRKHVAAAGIRSPVSPHTFRHCCATHLLEGGADLRMVQEMLGHASIVTTEIYTHVDSAYLKEVHRTFHPRCKSARDGGNHDPDPDPLP